MSWDLLFQIWQYGQDMVANEKAKIDADIEFNRMQDLILRQEKLVQQEKEEEDRIKKEEEDRIKKEEEDRIKALEDERLSTVWTAQNILKKYLQKKD